MKASVATDPMDRAPLLGVSIWNFKSAGEWRNHVEGFYDATAGKKGKKKKAEVKAFAYSRTKIGSIVFRIKRNPKFIYRSELSECASTLQLEPLEVEKLLKKRKIEVRKDAEEKKLRSLNEILSQSSSRKEETNARDSVLGITPDKQTA